MANPYEEAVWFLDKYGITLCIMCWQQWQDPILTACEYRNIADSMIHRNEYSLKKSLENLGKESIVLL